MGPNKISSKNLLFCALKEVQVGKSSTSRAESSLFLVFEAAGSKLTFLKMNVVSFTVYLMILLKCGGGN